MKTTKKQQRIYNRTSERLLQVTVYIGCYKFPFLKRFRRFAYQFGPKAVSEFCHRYAKKALGPTYHFESKTPYFKGGKLTKAGRNAIDINPVEL